MFGASEIPAWVITPIAGPDNLILSTRTYIVEAENWLSPQFPDFQKHTMKRHSQRFPQDW